jgi:putative stress-responsive envelope protein
LQQGPDTWSWSESELKNYLDSYGIPAPQGSTTNKTRAAARKNYNFFKHGTATPSGTISAKVGDTIQGTWNWVAEQVGPAVGGISLFAEALEKRILALYSLAWCPVWLTICAL